MAWRGVGRACVRGQKGRDGRVRLPPSTPPPSPHEKTREIFIWMNGFNKDDVNMVVVVGKPSKTRSKVFKSINFIINKEVSSPVSCRCQ